MGTKRSGLFDRFVVKKWSKEKRLAELRKHALAGDSEWVAYLLKETGYETYPDLLTRDWWTSGAPPGLGNEQAEVGAKVARYLLDTISRDLLPDKVAELVPAGKVDKDLVVLKLRAGKAPKLGRKK